jgi:hypothetical protein
MITLLEMKYGTSNAGNVLPKNPFDRFTGKYSASSMDEPKEP